MTDVGLTMFSWTQDLLDGPETPDEIVARVAGLGLADWIEVDAGQHFRTYPRIADAELASLRAALGSARPSLLGIYLDDATSPTTFLDDDARFALLEVQLRAAATLGCWGARISVGATAGILDRAVPLLEELDLVLLEEVQGGASPASPAIEEIVRVDSPHVRVLLDTSVSLPAPPISLLEDLERLGIPADTLTTIDRDWLDPAISGLVAQLMGDPSTPGPAKPLLLAFLTRFGRSSPEDWRPVLPLVRAAHLKFWDLLDEGGRVTKPIDGFAAEFANADVALVAGEWGGSDWLGDRADSTETSIAYLDLVRPRFGVAA